MKFSEQWLREWVDPAVETEQLCHQLTMAGLEVESVRPAAANLSRIVVGVIESVEPHPQADKLVVCQVNCGEAQQRKIVCGAPNARSGLHVPAALPGAELPGGICIEASELRGVHSEGMLCGGSELGLSEDTDGLLELDPDAKPGTSISAHLELDDQVIEIDLTPNRGDCLSVQGVAREVGVWNRLSVARPESPSIQTSKPSAIDVDVRDDQSCPVYAGRSLIGIDANARTPDWLCERLRRGGIRPIFPVVDVTNYILLELGQPMHAFDQNTLNGGITVRRAAEGESLTLLDDRDVTLIPETLVIADDVGPVAMAGAMGGARTGVGADTCDIFLESACFTPLAVAGQGRRYKVQSDSLHRFERGVDPELQVQALDRATQLIQKIAGGEAREVVCAGNGAGQAQSIYLRGTRIERILGTAVPGDEVVDILQRLEMSVENVTNGWQVAPPSHRYDIELEADLIEEIARIHGYDQLPSQQRPVFTAMANDQEQFRPIGDIREILRQRGYDEAITYSFVDPELQEQLDPDSEAVDLDNPIADNLSRMRTTLWASLIPCWLHNIRRQQKRVRFFETGLRFWRDNDAKLGVAQRDTLAGLVYGPVSEEHWGTSIRSLDFFDAKGDVEALFAASKCTITFHPDTHSALHPGRCARVHVDGEAAGWLGQLHPDFAKTLDTKDLPYVFELDYAAVQQAHIPHIAAVSEFPEVRRDLAFTVPRSLTAGDLRTVLEQAEEPLLQRVGIFDVFSGGELEENTKSIAFGLIFQDKTSTLTADGVEAAVARLIEQARQHCGAEIRGQ